MAKDEQFVIRFPTKLTARHLTIVIVFAIFMYFLVSVMKDILGKEFGNTNITIIAIALILVIIGLVSMYTIGSLSMEK